MLGESSTQDSRQGMLALSDLTEKRDQTLSVGHVAHTFFVTSVDTDNLSSSRPPAFAVTYAVPKIRENGE